MTRKLNLLKILDELGILYTDLNDLIGDYDAMHQWESKAYTGWIPNGTPTGITSSRKHLYITYSSSIIMYNKLGERLKEKSSDSSGAWGIDIDETKNLLCFINYDTITILNLKLTLIKSWPLPTSPYYGFRGIKMNNDILYLTIEGCHRLFILQISDGTNVTTRGKVNSGSKPEEFNYPNGITVCSNYIYVCDRNNHRVQILKKERVTYSHQWGGDDQSRFLNPCSIYYHILEEIFYIGDKYSIQLFSIDNMFIQRLEEDNDDEGHKKKRWIVE